MFNDPLNVLWMVYLGIVFIEELGLMYAIRWQRKRAQEADGDTYTAMLPRYRNILHLVLIQLLCDGLLGMWFLQVPVPCVFVKIDIAHHSTVKP